MTKIREKKTGLSLVLLAGLAATYGCSDDTTSNTTGPGAAASGGFQITVSGEDLSVEGYDFTSDGKANDDPPNFVDGWEVRFKHVIVTVDKIRINEDPDRDPADPTALGPVVASVDGPFAVDATIGGPITGKSGEPSEKTVEIATIARQANGQPFDPSKRYAFGFDFVAASASAKLVNLDAEGRALYEEAKTKGWATVYQGTATYRGPEPAAGSVFAKLPKVVNFKLGFKNPSTHVNCANTDFTPVGEEYPRGVQASADRVTTAQITMHTDHVFWSKLNVEGTELHFDPIAARASSYGTPDTPGDVTIEDLASADVTAFTTKAGEPLPARSFVSDYTAPAGTLSYDPNGTTFSQANSFAAYLAYTAASGGHLNEVGECAIQNNFTP